MSSFAAPEYFCLSAIEGLGQPQPQAVLFIDSRVPELQTLIAAAEPGVKVVVLEANQDGLHQMAQALSGLKDLSAVSVVSHGDAGMLLLGSSAVFGGNLKEHAADLQAIGHALSADGDLQLYGCDVGAGDKGAQFLAEMAQLTGADVAASTDATGASARGGDWTLEIATGTIDSTPVLRSDALDGFDYLLHTASVNTVAQLKAAIATAVSDGSDDTITLTGNITFASVADAITINVTDGHKLSIVGAGFTLSGGNYTRVLDVQGGSVAIDNLTITNGKLSGTGGSGDTGNIGGAGGDSLGAGIRNAGTLVITNSTITSNKAAGGGGGGGSTTGLYSGGGGGAGGFGAGNGAAGGVGAGGLNAGAVSGITGGTGGGNGGRGGGGGSSTGGAASSYSGTGYAVGGSGATATNGSISIGGGGGGTGTNRTGGAGGTAVGGVYNTGTLTITGSIITNNLGAGGGGGGGAAVAYSNLGNGGAGGAGIGGIWNKGGIVNIDASTNTSLSTGNVGAGGSGGTAIGGTNTNGANGSATSTLITTNGGSQNTNYIPNPTVTSVTSSTSNGSYKAGDTISIDVNFDAAVTVTGTPQLTLETGTTDRTINYASGSGSSTLTFTYTVQAGDTSSDLDYTTTGALTLNGGTIRDGSSNDATLTLPTPGAAGSLGANKALVIDTTAPTVSGVTSSTADGSYKVGDTVSVQVNFSEAVTVTGTPQLTLETGTTDEVVNYASGSGSSTLTFTYTVQAGDSSADLDYISTSALALNSGTIRDGAGNNATLTLASPGAANSLGANKAIVIDGVVPTVSGVTASTADGSYKVGDVISVQVNFSEVVTVTGTPQLTLETGTTDRVVNYASGSGSSTLTFSYTVQAGDTSPDLDYQSTGALALNSGTIKDAAGNNATLTLPAPGAAGSLGANKAIVVDGVVPTVSGVTSSTADGTYGVGATVSVQVNFSEVVTVTGTPQLTLETGTTDEVVNYASGSGSSTLTFTYTVQAGDSSADLDYLGTSALALNGGTIQDAVGNNATLTLASPGAAGSLGANNAIVINTAGPTVGIVVADTALKIGDTSGVTFTFSEAVSGFTNADLTVANGTLTAVSSSDGGTTWTATLTPTASIEDATNVIAIDMTGVASIATSTAGSGTTNSNNYAIDTVRPALASAITISDTALKIGDTATVTFTFTEAVTGFTAADVTVANGALTNLSSSDGGITWTATLTPSASTQDATNVITLDNTGITDAAGNTGSGSTDSGNYAIDTQRPTVSIGLSDTALKIGETATVTFTFSEAVTGFTSADLLADNGSVTGLSSSDGGITWTATFTPDNGITSATNVITLDNTGVADVAGNAGSGTVDSGNYAIDTQRPTLASAITISDTALKVGDTATVTFTFSEAVTGFTAADVTVPNGALTNLSSSDGGITWTATLTPTASVEDATNVISLDNTGISDAAGNAGSGSTDSGNYTVDTLRPTATLVLADTALKIGDTSGVTITFSEAVSGFTNADLTITNGTLTSVSSGDGGITWTATFTPTASLTDATNVITLNNAGVIDLAGNAGSGSTDSNNYAIDTQRPTAVITLSDNALISGETAQVTIGFSEPVSGFTNADLTVPNGNLGAVSSSDGGSTWTATYTPNNAVLDASNVITLDNSGVSDAAGNAGAGSTDSANFTIDTTDNVAPVLASAVADGTSLVLTYTDANPLNAVNTAPASSFAVTSGGVANTVTGVVVDGAARTVTLTLDTAVLQGEAVSVAYTDPTAGNDTNATQDLAGNDAVSFGAQAAVNITGPDATPPTATLSVADTDLAAGENTSLTITFSEPVADLTLADLSAGSGSLSGLQQINAKTWTALLQPYVNTNAASNVVTLQAGTIHDRSGNPGVGSYSSNAYAVRTLDPVASISLDDSLLSRGETTSVTVQFKQAVSGLDAGDFSVQGGSLGTPASSDGGLTWHATFTPTAGYSSPSNVIVLNHSGIRNAQGQVGSGSTSSANYVIDTLAPTLSISSDQSVLGAGQSATLSFTFSETPSGFGAEDISVRGGSLSALAPTADPRVYTAKFTPSDTLNGLSVAGSGYSDLAGNAGTDASFRGLTLDNALPVFDPGVSSPADDAAAVAVGSTLVLHFSEALSAGRSNLAGVSLRNLADGSVVPAAVSLDANGQLVIDPSADLAFDTTYAVAWGAGSLQDAAGNAVAALAAGSTYNFRTASAPTSGPGTQDGVPVTVVTTPNPDGSSTETVSTPPVPATRPEDPNTPNSSLADLVVAKDGDGAALLTVSLPVGVGLRSEVTTGGSLSLREQLVNAATAHESDATALQLLIDAGIDQFVPGVPDASQVTVRTLTLQPGAELGAQPIVITGAQGFGEGSAEHPQRQEALVIDTSQLPTGPLLQLDDVEFAIIIGAPRVVGGRGSNIVFGDGGSQFIVLGAEDDQLHGGGGDDTIGSKGGNDMLYGDDGNDHLVGGIGNDTLEGGAGNDVLQGGPSDAGTWTFQINPQGQIESRFATAEADLGGPLSDSHLGPWTPTNLPPDSDDRLAYSYQSADRLQDVAMLYRAATGQLPSLDELNAYSGSGLTSHQLAQAAYDFYAVNHVLPQAIELQVKALVETVWGAGTASDAILALGTDYIGQGGNWADALLYLARDAQSTQRSTDGQGNLNLTVPLHTSELGWNADAGNDVLRGGAGDDRLVGGRGSDWLDGGAGTDTAVFTGSVRDYHFHKTTVDGVAQLVMQSSFSTDVDTLVSIERWEIGSRTYEAASALAALPDNVDKPLADFLVELVGQAPLPSPGDGFGG